MSSLHQKFNTMIILLGSNNKQKPKMQLLQCFPLMHSPGSPIVFLVPSYSTSDFIGNTIHTNFESLNYLLKIRKFYVKVDKMLGSHFHWNMYNLDRVKKRAGKRVCLSISQRGACIMFRVSKNVNHEDERRKYNLWIKWVWCSFVF